MVFKIDGEYFVYLSFLCGFFDKIKKYVQFYKKEFQPLVPKLAFDEFVPQIDYLFLQIEEEHIPVR